MIFVFLWLQCAHPDQLSAVLFPLCDLLLGILFVARAYAQAHSTGAESCVDQDPQFLREWVVCRPPPTQRVCSCHLPSGYLPSHFVLTWCFSR